MSEWNSKNKPGVKSRDAEYPDLTTDFADPSNSANQYRGKDNLVGWYRFLGDGAVGRVDGGTTNTFPNMAKTGSDGQTLTTSGSLGSAVYYEESLYGAAVTYKAHYQSPFDQPGAAAPADQWSNSFNQQVTPYLPTNMAHGALPFSGSKAEQNYFRITDTDAWNIYEPTASPGNGFSVALWVRLNDYSTGGQQQDGDTRLPIITKVKQGEDWTAGGEFAAYWSIQSTSFMNIRCNVMTDVSNYYYARSGYFRNTSNTDRLVSDSSYPEPLAEVPPDGSWVHIVMTWNGTATGSGDTKPDSNTTMAIKVYINGHFMMYDTQYTGTFTGIRPATNSTCGDILINSGRDDDDPDQASKYTNQDVAEAAFWSRALSPREIKALYHAQTIGIKKYDTGLVKNPPRPQLQRLDDTAGNAYPTIGGSADQFRLGKRTPHFDDTLTRIFTQSYQNVITKMQLPTPYAITVSGSEPIMMGTRMRVTDPLLSASFSTPNKLPTLVVSGSNKFGVAPNIMGNLPFLTASVTQFKDPYTPFNDSSVHLGDSPFYMTGSTSMPGFNTRLGNKVQIIIDTNPVAPTTLGMESAGFKNEQWFMAYWNKDRSVWEKIGRGYVGTAAAAVSQASSPFAGYVPYIGGDQSPDLDASTFHYEGPVQRNVNFASVGFSGMGFREPAVSWIKEIEDGGNGVSIYPISEVKYPSVGRPTDFYGFPFDARYHATGSQQINMSDYIDAPFLLEKIEVHYSSSEAMGYGNYQMYQGMMMQLYQQSNGNNFATPTSTWGKVTTFFILRQRKGKFQYVRPYQGGEKYTDGSQVAAIRGTLTSSIPGKRVVNQDGQNSQDINSMEWVHDTRDLVTYSQHGWFGNERDGRGTGIGKFNPTAWVLPDPFASNPIGYFVSGGMGRDLNTYINWNRQTGPAGSAMHKERGWWWPAAGQITGSFIITGSCKTSPIDRTGPTAEAMYSSNQGQFQRPLVLGGRLNPTNELTDRRGFVKGLPAGLTASEGWIGYTRNSTPVNASNPTGGRSYHLTASTPETWTDTASPYLLLPEDKIVIGCQSDMPSWQVNSWPSKVDEAPGNDGSGNEYWETDKPGWATTLQPGGGKVVLYGSYVKNHRTTNNSLNQQLTTDSVHGVVSSGPVYDQWEIDIKEAYSGSYLDEAISGSMTNPPVGWPRAPATRQPSLWASASSTPIPGHRFTGNPLYRDRGGAFDGSIKPWVSSSAYHSSSVYGMYFGTSMVRGSGIDWVGAEGGCPMVDQAGMEPASSRRVVGTVYEGGTGDVFGFQRNVRLNCEEETYYDSLVPDPGVCWVADNQPLGYGGGNIQETIEKDGIATLGIGASNAGSHQGSTLVDDGGPYDYGSGKTRYTNEWWLPSFPFEARYRGFTEPPTDEFKRLIDHQPYLVRMCAPLFGTSTESWQGFGPSGDESPCQAQSSKVVGLPTIYVDGLKPGLQRSTSATATPEILGDTTSDRDMPGTVLPMLFGFGSGISGSVSPYNRMAATGSNAYTSIYAGQMKYIANKPRGCKYGLYSWKPRITSTIFRSTRFGQFSDMLEQRRYTRFFLKKDGAVEVSAPVFCQFKEPTWLAPTDDTDKTAVSTQCSNLSIFATASIPYFDGEVKNRGPLIADGSDTIVIE